MNITDFFLGPKGLLAIQVIQLAFFTTLAYILTVEWHRTGRHELRSKVIAVSSAILQLLLSSLILFLKIFYNIEPSERFVPLISSMLTITTIVFLWHAFLYSSIQNTKKLAGYAVIVFSTIVLVFSMITLFWNFSYNGRTAFNNSIWYLAFELFFLTADGVIISTILRFKGIYRYRVIAGFTALFVVHLIGAYSYFQAIPPVLQTIKTSLPILVPIMFGTVMYKELIDHLVNLNNSLKEALTEQGALIMHISRIDNTVNRVINKTEEHITIKLEENTLSSKDRETFEQMISSFQEVKEHLAKVDREVFATMEKVIEYDDVMLK